jgi:hypothetical protein
VRRTLAILVFIAACLTTGAAAATDFIDNPADRNQALDALRTAIGPHPRVLSVRVEATEVTIEAQDPNNRRHVDLWRYVVRDLGLFSFNAKVGPTPAPLNLLDPDLEANLFDLDAVDFSAAAQLIQQSVRRAHIEDDADVTRMEIKRQIHILPQPTAGDIRWTLDVRSAREQATVTADARGTILGANLSGTRWAQTVDFFKDPAFAVEAAAEFREKVGSEPMLTAVTIRNQSIGFTTNIKDRAMANMGLQTAQTFSWRLGGLTRNLGGATLLPPEVQQMMQHQPQQFAIGDVD